MPPKRWLELKIEVPFEYVEPVAELFHAYGKGGVVIEQAGVWNPDEGEPPPERPSAVLRTYMPQTPAFRSKRELVHIGVALIAKLTDLPELEEREIAEEEWEAAWKAHFTPLRVGHHLLVQPPWQTAEPQPGDVVIEIDPGLAFGTGHHETTRLCLAALDQTVVSGVRVLEVGAIDLAGPGRGGVDDAGERQAGEVQEVDVLDEQALEFGLGRRRDLLDFGLQCLDDEASSPVNLALVFVHLVGGQCPGRIFKLSHQEVSVRITSHDLESCPSFPGRLDPQHGIQPSVEDTATSPRTFRILPGVVDNDNGQIINTGENVPPTVFPAIKKRLGNPL
ncbi:MAG: 50S ribosomal protein L11 methyltransferase, partial [Planctomycetes bacterium]|nr:50S ribosomal protein L11 methyltransferase [Planctomycetota bacterium]